MWETWVQSLGWEDTLEKGKATHSSILAWRVPWTIQAMESQRVRHAWATFTFTFTFKNNKLPAKSSKKWSWGGSQRCVSPGPHFWWEITWGLRDIGWKHGLPISEGLLWLLCGKWTAEVENESQREARSFPRSPDRTGTWSDLPGSPVVKRFHSNARDASSIPDGGTKIPHAWCDQKIYFF